MKKQEKDQNKKAPERKQKKFSFLLLLLSALAVITVLFLFAPIMELKLFVFVGGLVLLLFLSRQSGGFRNLYIFTSLLLILVNIGVLAFLVWLMLPGTEFVFRDLALSGVSGTMASSIGIVLGFWVLHNKNFISSPTKNGVSSLLFFLLIAGLVGYYFVTKFPGSVLAPHLSTLLLITSILLWSAALIIFEKTIFAGGIIKKDPVNQRREGQS